MFNADGTCSYRRSDGGVDVAMDVAPDAAETDVAADATETDVVADALPDAPVQCYSVTMPLDAGVSPGQIDGGGDATWVRCCVQNQQRLCFGHLGGISQCNYSFSSCEDGTCRPMGTTCEPVDATDANAASP
jgi:hypothetical protein